MPYATTTDLLNLGLPSGALGMHDGTAQTECLAAASAVADSYLSQRYSLPLLTWGKDLTRCVVAIARWDLLCRKGFNPENPADQAIRLSYKDAVAWLQMIADGSLTPTSVTPTPGEPTDGTTDGPVAESDEARGW